jgi:hypothetical protein
MKKIFFLLLICITTFNINAQEEDEKFETKNYVGIVLSDLINGSIQFKYERLIGKHISIGIGIAYKNEDGLIKLSGIDREQIKTSDITYSGFKIIPEVRYYINKTQQYSMDGFYFGAYFKYSNYTSDLDGTYINDLAEEFIIEFDADIEVLSVGFMIGYKLPISKRLTIDFIIAGPGAAFHNFSLVNKRDLPDEFYEDFNEALENYSFLDFLDSDFRFSSTNLKSDVFLPAFRYGVTLGYSF